LEDDDARAFILDDGDRLTAAYTAQPGSGLHWARLDSVRAGCNKQVRLVPHVTIGAVTAVAVASLACEGEFSPADTFWRDMLSSQEPCSYRVFAVCEETKWI
jgi:hypothetical protein